MLRTLSSLIIRVVGAFSAFLVSVVIGRSLGVEESGYYFLSFTIVTFLSAISRAGLENTLVRFTGLAHSENQWGAIKSLLFKSLLISTLVAIFVVSILMIFSDYIAASIFFMPPLAEPLFYMAPAILGIAGFTLVSMSYQGFHKTLYSVFFVSICSNVLLGLYFFFLRPESVSEAALNFTFITILTFFLSLLVWLKFINNNDGVIAWSTIFNSCYPLWIVTVMYQLMQFSGQLISGIWEGPTQIAQLAVAQRTAMLISFILTAVSMVVAPKLSALYKGGDITEIKRLTVFSVRIMIVVSLPVLVTMLLFSAELLSLFGDGFSGGALLLQILVVGQFVNVITGTVGILLSMTGHEKQLRNTVLISGPLSILLALLFVPFIGVVGSAIATSIAVIVQNLLAVWYAHKHLGINTLNIWK